MHLSNKHQETLREKKCLLFTSRRGYRAHWGPQSKVVGREADRGQTPERERNWGSAFIGVENAVPRLSQAYSSYLKQE